MDFVKTQHEDQLRQEQDRTAVHPWNLLVKFPYAFGLLASPTQGKPIDYARKDEMTPLQRHCAFFDLDRDGILSLGDTWRGFRLLGYGLILSFFGI